MTTTSESRGGRPALLALALASLALASLAAGCSAPSGYLARQAWGQLKAMHRRERIVDLLRRPGLTPERREKLTLVLLARQYAHEVIGLRLTSSYTRFYDTGGGPLAYNLSAAPKDRLAPKVWRFPIVGGLPYLGFFDRARAERERQALERDGLDTELRPVPAFSSLGWFADPVYSPMLEAEIGRLVEVVIHETTHTTIFLRNQVAFNESLAVFVGDQGSLNFLARVYGPLSPEVRRHAAAIGRRRIFGELIAELYQRLERLYGARIPRDEKLRQRELCFAWAQRRYKELFPDPATWSDFVRRPLNNAVVLNFGRYNQGLAFHTRVYRALGSDLGRMVALYVRAQRFADPIGYVARAVGLEGFIQQRM
jgi:predicted aminopeptidase